MMATNDELPDTNDDEFLLDEPRGDAPQQQSFLYIMNSYAREFIFVLAVAFTAIAALQNGPLKTQKAKAPLPFFPEPTLVTDYFLGEFDSLSSLILEKDVSLVMYYAPWDANSMHVKHEYEKAAKLYHKEVFFAAINCWWPEGECNRKYKIISYPLLVAYVHDQGTVHFVGPLVANYIISFLDNVLFPLKTIHHKGELLELLAKHDGVLIGYFDFSKKIQPKGYNILYSTALQALARDPLRRLSFAVITNPKVRIKFEFKTSFQLYLWNRTEVYTAKTFSTSELLDWAYGKLDQVSRWITPPGVKSTLLSDVVEKSATLILFTPQNFLLDSSPYYDLLREVALDYNNCNNSAQVTSLIHRLVLRRHILQEALTRLFEKCHIPTDGYNEDFEQSLKRRDLTCCQLLYLKLKLIAPEQCFCRLCIHHTVKAVDRMKLSECENTLSLILKTLGESSFPLDQHTSCQMVEASYPIKFGDYHRLSLKCDDEPEGEESAAVSIDDDLAQKVGVKDDRVISMLNNLERNMCGKLKFALNYSDINFPEFPPAGNMSWQFNFSGLGCNTNRSLLFIAMDSTLFHFFAENLGIDVLDAHHQTAAIIVDAKHESSYVLPGSIHKRSLVEFIKNYTAGTLERYLRSVVRKLDGCEDQEGKFCVPELSTATFFDYVLDEESDVVLMYYAPWCGQCSAVHHVFLTVAHYFSTFDGIKFARISGDDHDLPWEYTVEKYPTILFFPAYGKEETIAYPSNLPITVDNLLFFILFHCQPYLQWDLAMHACDHKCLSYNIARCIGERRRLFRHYHLSLNELHFTHQKMLTRTKTKFKKFIRIKKGHIVESNKEPFSITKYLVRRIQRKRRKIEQAFDLIILLQKQLKAYVKRMDLDGSNLSTGNFDMNPEFVTPVPQVPRVPGLGLEPASSAAPEPQRDEL